MNKRLIEQEIKDFSTNYEINLSGDKILNEFNKRYPSLKIKQEIPKKKESFFYKFVPFTAVAAIGLVAIIAVNLPFNNSGIDSTVENGYTQNSQVTIIDTPQELGGKRSQIAFQIYSTLAFVDYDNPVTGQIKSKYHYGDDKNDDRNHKDNDKLTFSDVVSEFDEALTTISTLFENGIEVENVLEKGEFIGVYDTYEYKMVISDDYTFLTNITFESEDDEIESNNNKPHPGEGNDDKHEDFSEFNEQFPPNEFVDSNNIQDDNHDIHNENDVNNELSSLSENETETNYTGEIVSKNKSNLKVFISSEKKPDGEEEIELHIELDKNTHIYIEQEVENDEREYSYVVEENKKEVYSQRIKIKNNNEKKNYCHLEIKNNQNIFQFKDIIPTENGVSSSYKTINLSGQFEMTYTEIGKEYVDCFTKEKIIL